MCLRSLRTTALRNLTTGKPVPSLQGEAYGAIHRFDAMEYEPLPGRIYTGPPACLELLHPHPPHTSKHNGSDPHSPRRHADA